MLVAAAAEKLNVDANALITEAGFVVDAAGKRRIAYGELTDAAAKMPVPTDVKLKNPSTFRIVGTPAKRLDVAGKVDGSAVFGIDVKLPNMQIATVAASPWRVFGGTLASLDEAAALKVPGVHQVAKLDNAVAVIAEHYWAARERPRSGKSKVRRRASCLVDHGRCRRGPGQGVRTTGSGRQKRRRCDLRVGKRRYQGRRHL